MKSQNNFFKTLTAGTGNFFKTLTAGTGLVICGTALLSPALAQTVTPTQGTITPTGTVKPTTTKKPNETAAQKCERITKKVEEKKDELKAKDLEKPLSMNGLLKRNEDYAIKLKAEGFDTTELEADIAKLKTSLTTRNSLRLSLALAALDKVKDIQCNKVKKEDIKAVFEAKKKEYETQKDKFQAEVKAILQEILGDLKTIRAERKTQKQEAKPSVKPSGTRKPEGTTKPSGTPKPSSTEKPKATIKPSQTVKPSGTVKPTEIEQEAE
jgi:hypothetical protein